MAAATTRMNDGLLSTGSGPLKELLGNCCEELRDRTCPGGPSVTASIFLKRLLRDDRGATAIEYGLIVSLIVIAIIGALGGVADANAGMWAYVRDNILPVMGA